MAVIETKKKDPYENLGPIDKKLLELLNLDKHVVYALSEIARFETGFKNSRISSIKDVIVLACNQRAETYNRYRI